MAKHKRSFVKLLVSKLLGLCFLAYMALLMYFLFFSERYGRTATYNDYQYNFTLFREIKRYVDYRALFGDELFLINVVGNLLAFVPFGFLLPVMYREQRKYRVIEGHYVKSFFFVTFMGFVFSLFVETLQLVTKVGCFDVDDLFLNTIGVMIGYICYVISKGIIRRMQ